MRYQKNHPPPPLHQFVSYKASSIYLLYLEHPIIKKLVISTILSRLDRGGGIIRNLSIEEVDDKTGFQEL